MDCLSILSHSEELGAEPSASFSALSRAAGAVLSSSSRVTSFHEHLACFLVQPRHAVRFLMQSICSLRQRSHGGMTLSPRFIVSIRDIISALYGPPSSRFHVCGFCCGISEAGVLGIGTEDVCTSVNFSGRALSDCLRESARRAGWLTRRGSSVAGTVSLREVDRYTELIVSRRTVSGVIPAARSLGVRNLLIQSSACPIPALSGGRL